MMKSNSVVRFGGNGRAPSTSDILNSKEICAESERAVNVTQPVSKNKGSTLFKVK